MYTIFRQLLQTAAANENEQHLYASYNIYKYIVQENERNVINCLSPYTAAHCVVNGECLI